MSKIRELPLVYRKRPFAGAPYEQFEMPDKGNLVDERICLELDMPIKDLCYNKFTILPGLVSRQTGFIKISVQQITRGKIGESIQFNARVIRNLSKMLGIEAVYSHSLAEKLCDFPLVKPTKPGKNVDKWIQKHYGPPAKSLHSGTSDFRTSYPTGTPTSPPCTCDWSHAATAAKSLQCCMHRGLCPECQDNLDDLTEDLQDTEISKEQHRVHDLEYDPRSEISTNSGSDACDDSISIGSWTAMDPLNTDNSSSDDSSFVKAHAEKVQAHMVHIQRVRAQNGNWLRQFRPTQREIIDTEKNLQDDNDFLDSHFPGGTRAARNIAEYLGQKYDEEDKTKSDDDKKNFKPPSKPPFKPWIEQEEERKLKAKKKQKRTKHMK